MTFFCNQWVIMSCMWDLSVFQLRISKGQGVNHKKGTGQYSGKGRSTPCENDLAGTLLMAMIDWLLILDLEKPHKECGCLKSSDKYFMHVQHVQDENKLTINTKDRSCNRVRSGWWMRKFELQLHGIFTRA